MLWVFGVFLCFGYAQMINNYKENKEINAFSLLNDLGFLQLSLMLTKIISIYMAEILGTQLYIWLIKYHQISECSS
jgi:hypothetical protein